MQAFAPLNRTDLGSLTREPGSVAHDSRALSGRPWPPDPRAVSVCPKSTCVPHSSCPLLARETLHLSAVCALQTSPRFVGESPAQRMSPTRSCRRSPPLSVPASSPDKDFLPLSHAAHLRPHLGPLYSEACGTCHPAATQEERPRLTTHSSYVTQLF